MQDRRAIPAQIAVTAEDCQLEVRRIAAADHAPAYLAITLTNGWGQAVSLLFEGNGAAQRFAERLEQALREARRR
jgi:hypothetical protein